MEEEDEDNNDQEVMLLLLLLLLLLMMMMMMMMTTTIVVVVVVMMMMMMMMMMMIYTGFQAYVGYMHMEAAHTHPVVVIFTRLMLLGLQNKRERLQTRAGSQALNGDKQIEMAKREKTIQREGDVKTGSKYGAVDCPETTGPPTESPC